VTQAK